MCRCESIAKAVPKERRGARFGNAHIRRISRATSTSCRCYGWNVTSAQARLATPSDLPTVRSLVTAAYGKYIDRMDRPPAPMQRDYGEAIDAGVLWVVGEPVVGLISLLPVSESTLSVENVAVLPAAQGTGVGRRLMEFAQERALDLGLRRLALFTNAAMTEIVTLYSHLGFVEVDRRHEDGYQRVCFEKELDTA